MSQPMERNSPSVRSKPGWRRAIIAAILALDPGERRAQESALIAAFPDLPGFAAAETVLLYVSAFPEELETREILACAFDRGKRVLCPACRALIGLIRYYFVECVRLTMMILAIMRRFLYAEIGRNSLTLKCDVIRRAKIPGAQRLQIKYFL